MHQENLNNLPQNKNQTHLNDYAITTPIQPIILKAFLAGYDKKSTEFLIKGFYQGFKKRMSDY
jgi:hypothetical protein